MENIGAKLKKIRLEKGFTLEEVQKKTKIHLNILKAIEEDSIVNLSPIYIKGFLKIYCNLLGVNSQGYITDSNEAVKPLVLKPVSAKENKQASLVKAEPFWALLVNFIRAKIKVILFVLIICASGIGLLNFGKFVVSRIKSLPKEQRVKMQLPKKSVSQQTVVNSKNSEKVIASKAQKPQSYESSTAAKSPRSDAFTSAIRLGVRAKGDCWITVKSDGKIIFQNNLKKGRSENWQAKEKIELSLGNAGVVELEVNGKFISSLGRRGQSIKNILITKDGLSIPR